MRSIPKATIEIHPCLYDRKGTLTTFILHLELLLLPMETEKWKLEGSNVKSSRLPDKKLIGKRLVWVILRFKGPLKIQRSILCLVSHVLTYQLKHTIHSQIESSQTTPIMFSLDSPYYQTF
jgi:hypothetical protein